MNFSQACFFLSKSINSPQYTASQISMGVNAKCKQSECHCHSDGGVNPGQSAPRHGFLASQTRLKYTDESSA